MGLVVVGGWGIRSGRTWAWGLLWFVCGDGDVCAWWVVGVGVAFSGVPGGDAGVVADEACAFDCVAYGA